MVNELFFSRKEFDTVPQIIDALVQMGERPRKSDFATLGEAQEVWEILDNKFQELVDGFGEQLVFYAQEQVANLQCGICRSKERGHYHRTMDGTWQKALYDLEL